MSFFSTAVYTSGGSVTSPFLNKNGSQKLCGNSRRCLPLRNIRAEEMEWRVIYESLRREDERERERLRVTEESEEGL